MREGRPDLRLFHQLYWIIVSAELLVMYIVFPGAQIIQGTFPSETVPGRVCLLLQTTSGSGSSASYESETYKLKMFRLFFSSISRCRTLTRYPPALKCGGRPECQA